MVVAGGMPKADPAHADYDVSRDGAFAMRQARKRAPSAVLVHNWALELREKLAAVKKQ